MKKALLTTCIFASTMFGAVPVTMTPFGSTGAAQQVGTNTSTISAMQITFQAALTNSTTACSTATYTGCPRIGDANISGTQGIFLVPGATYTIAPPTTTDVIPLSAWWVLVPQSGDKVVVTYVQ